MQELAARLENTRLGGLFGLIMVLLGLAVGHTGVVLQHHLTGGISLLDSVGDR
jgi:hypothetical protein